MRAASIFTLITQQAKVTVHLSLLCQVSCEGVYLTNRLRTYAVYDRCSI